MAIASVMNMVVVVRFKIGFVVPLHINLIEDILESPNAKEKEISSFV